MHGCWASPLYAASGAAADHRRRGRTARVVRKFSTDRPRWGWRRAAKTARKAGWKVNNKRIRRLWRDEGLAGASTATQETSDRDRRSCRGDVPDPPERDLGNGLPV
jgi:hypothetical protein